MPNEELPNHVPEASACGLPSHAKTSAQATYQKSEDEWRELLTPDQFRVLRQHGTEPPFRNEYFDHKAKGLYLCAGCSAPLFASGEKFDSRTGWPSFYDAIEPENVGRTIDDSYGMIRTEVHCQRCGGHLGHAFDDGPAPTGLRFCINSASIEFVEAAEIESRNLRPYAEHAK